MVTLIVQHIGEHRRLKPGSIFKHEIIEDDFVFNPNTTPVTVNILIGDKRYKAGTTLKLFLASSGTAAYITKQFELDGVSFDNTEAGGALLNSTSTIEGDNKIKTLETYNGLVTAVFKLPRTKPVFLDEYTLPAGVTLLGAANDGSYWEVSVTYAEKGGILNFITKVDAKVFNFKMLDTAFDGGVFDTALPVYGTAEIVSASGTPTCDGSILTIPVPADTPLVRLRIKIPIPYNAVWDSYPVSLPDFNNSIKLPANCTVISAEVIEPDELFYLAVIDVDTSGEGGDITFDYKVQLFIEVMSGGQYGMSHIKVDLSEDGGATWLPSPEGTNLMQDDTIQHSDDGYYGASGNTFLATKDALPVPILLWSGIQYKIRIADFIAGQYITFGRGAYAADSLEAAVSKVGNCGIFTTGKLGYVDFDGRIENTSGYKAAKAFIAFWLNTDGDVRWGAADAPALCGAPGAVVPAITMISIFNADNPLDGDANPGHEGAMGVVPIFTRFGNSQFYGDIVAHPSVSIQFQLPKLGGGTFADDYPSLSAGATLDSPPTVDGLTWIVDATFDLTVATEFHFNRV